MFFPSVHVDDLSPRSANTKCPHIALPASVTPFTVGAERRLPRGVRLLKGLIGFLVFSAFFLFPSNYVVSL